MAGRNLLDTKGFTLVTRDVVQALSHDNHGLQGLALAGRGSRLLNEAPDRLLLKTASGERVR